MRTIVDLPEEQVQALAELCDREQISRAEAVRRALSIMLNDEKLKKREDAFGGWQTKKVDSRKLVDGLREEWSR
ncbi:hypothetical protein BH11VER1_BH11VER1_26950 [soil metagenome]